MVDSVTKTTSKGWGGRLIESIKGVLFGLLLVGLSFPVLFWNEGRAKSTADAIDGARSAVVQSDATAVDPSQANMLLHLTGAMTTADTLSDPQFRVSEPAIRLRRNVEVYQWKESTRQETRNKIGGGTETVTTYSYNTEWVSVTSAQPSQEFEEPAGHFNPAVTLQDNTQDAPRVSLGAYTLPSQMVMDLTNWEPLAINANAVAGLTYEGRPVTSSGEYLYVGSPSSPTVGDYRVTFQVVRPGTVSIMGKQINSTFENWQTPDGDEFRMRIEPGTHSAQSMLATAESENAMMTWILRIVGFLMMWIGFGMIFRPIVVVAEFVPLIGSLVGAGASMAAFLLAAPLSLLTIAVAWITYRPLVGVSLLVVVGGLVGAAIWYVRKKNQAAAPPAG